MTPEERQRIIEEEKLRTVVREQEKARISLINTGVGCLVVLGIAYILSLFLFHH